MHSKILHRARVTARIGAPITAQEMLEAYTGLEKDPLTIIGEATIRAIADLMTEPVTLLKPPAAKNGNKRSRHSVTRAMNRVLGAVFLAFALTAASAAQTPGPVPLAVPRLHDGFTLTYTVTVRDVRSAALRLKNVADQRKGIAEELASGLMTPQQAAGFETQAASLGDHRPDEHFDITLSARDGKLLYLSTRGGRYLKEKIKDAILLDGDKAYEAVGSEAVSIENDAWRSAPVYRGENVDRLGFLPAASAWPAERRSDPASRPCRHDSRGASAN